MILLGKIFKSNVSKFYIDSISETDEFEFLEFPIIKKRMAKKFGFLKSNY